MLDLEMVHKTLAESEKKYRTLVTQSPDGIFIVDLQGTFLAVNKAMCERLKYSEEEFLSMKIWDIVPEEYVDLHKKRLADILRGKALNEAAEYVVRGKDEKMHYIEVLSNPYFRENELIGFQGIARDITERKKAEQALSESEQRYRNLVENAPDVIFTLTSDGTIISLNPAFEKITGYSRSEWLHKQFAPILHPDDLSRGLEFLQRVLKGEKIAPFELRVVRKSGDYLVAEFVVTSQTRNDSVIGVLGIARDITERKKVEQALRESEKKFQELFDEAPVGYHEIDKEGKIIRVNRTELDMLGYTAEEMLGRYECMNLSLRDIVSNCKVENWQVPLPLVQSFERTYLRKDGTTISVLVEETLIKDSEGRIIGIRTTIQDITERKRAEKEKATLLEQLRQSQKMEAIGQLAGGIAHDFNNLLTVIKGYNQLSQMELKEGDPLKENIGEIGKAAERAANLTRQLLAFSRRQMMEMRVLDLNNVLQRFR